MQLDFQHTIIMPSDNTIYQPFPHPSDIGLTIYGDTLTALYQNAAFAMFDTLCNLEQVEEKSEIKVTATGDDREQLLVNYLNELLYLQGVKGWLFRRVSVNTLDDNLIQATAHGDTYRVEIHELFHEIKSATYHNIRIRKQGGKWRVDIVFDV